MGLKARLNAICEECSRKALIRLACQELEAWYLGDFDALAEAFEDDKLRNQRDKRKYRNPDLLGSPSKELKNLVLSFQKISGARKMGQAISPSNNTSRSFQVFVQGVSHLVSGGAA